MLTLKREDGVVFTIRNYRESLVVKRPSLLRSEVRAISKNNGEYVRLFRPVVDRIEAVFSKSQGYPLGETVWQHFDKPQNMLYCEILPNQSEAILVVVRDGSVFLDDVIPVESLVDEFTSLVTTQNEFEIFLYGDVPLAEYTTEEKFAFDHATVKSFTELERSAYFALMPDSTLKLVSPDVAISSLGIGRVSRSVAIAAFAIIAVVIGFSIFTAVQESMEPEQPKIIKVDPYKQYERALETPAPDQQLKYILLKLDHTSHIPGWLPIRASFTPTQLVIEVETNGGNLNDLHRWLKQNKVRADLNTEKNSLNFTPNVPSRGVPGAILPRDDVMVSLVDELQRSLIDGKISIDKTKTFGRYSTSRVKVQFKNVSPSMIVWMGHEFKGQPVILQNFTATIKEGLLSGTLVFTVVGS